MTVRPAVAGRKAMKALQAAHSRIDFRQCVARGFDHLFEFA